MNDQTAGAGADSTHATKRDLVEGNIGKVFKDGFAADKPEQSAADEQRDTTALVERVTLPAVRPAFAVSAEEIDAAKMMSMAGPLIPVWLRANPGQCWAIIQMSKRWTRFDPVTNSWIHFDPITIAQASYLVTQQGGVENIAFMSVFIRALIDAFAPLQKKLRFAYEGEGESRVCIVSGLLKGEVEPHEYRTPPLSKITPKKSPLWASDPDRQLAYYGSRAWARLHCAGVLHGVYDPEELQGDVVNPERIEAEKIGALQTRLSAAAGNGNREGFRDGVVEEGLNGGQSAKDAKPGKGGGKDRTRAAKRGAGAQGSKEGRGKRENPLPKNLDEYRAHLARWLLTYDKEQDIEQRWTAEAGLRSTCCVPSIGPIRKELRAMVDQRIAGVRRA